MKHLSPGAGPRVYRTQMARQRQETRRLEIRRTTSPIVRLTWIRNRVKVRANQAKLLGNRNQFDERVYLELLHEVVAMPFDRALRRVKFAGNLLVELPANDQRKDFSLGRREGSDARTHDIESLVHGAILFLSRTIARSTACSNTSVATGLIRKSWAPAFTAKTLVGTSP